jgi:hypothetical protein
MKAPSSGLSQGSRHQDSARIFLNPLETKNGFANFSVATTAVAPGRLMGPGKETGTGRVRCRS